MNEVMTREQGNLPAEPLPDDPWSAYGEEADRGGMPLLRFKQGDWVAGGNAERIRPEDHVLVCIDQLEIGWRKWANNRLVASVNGRVADNFRSPPRDTLGDLDQSQWEMDLAGERPQDPWEEYNAMPALFAPGKSPIDTEEVLMVGNTKGFMGAVGKLSKAYGPHRRQHPNDLPVVSLGSSRYYNKTYRRDVDTPELKVVGWSTLENWGGESAPPTTAEPSQAELPHDEGVAHGESRRNF